MPPDDSVVEVKVSANKPARAYSNAARNFLQGTSENDPVDRIRITGLGAAIPTAAATAAALEKESVGSIVKVATEYPELPGSRGGTARLVIDVRRNSSLKRVPRAPALTVGQWNLAGINVNALEFKVKLGKDAPEGTSLALQFAEDLSNIVGSAVMGKKYKKKSELTLPELLAPLKDLGEKGSALAAAIHAKAVEGTCYDGKPAITLLRDAAKGSGPEGRYLGQADMAFKLREFTLLGLKPGNATEVFERYISDDTLAFWEEFVSSLERANPKAKDEELQHAVFICVFEGFLREFARKVLKKEHTAEEVAASIGLFAKLMGVDTASKTANIAQQIAGANGRCSPDVWTLQEFSRTWIEEPNFQGFWKDIEKKYFVLSPEQPYNETQVVQLLIRRDSILVLDKAATDKAKKLVVSAEFQEGLKATFTEIFASVAEAQLKEINKFYEEKMVIAVCSAGSHGKLLVVATHARSDGTDNRAQVIVVQRLAEALDCGLLLGLDANSNAAFDEKDVLRGAASQSVFVKLLESQKMTHCFQQLSRTCGDPQKFHTVKKMRTYLQAQIKKAGILDQSAKDWVVCTAPATKFRGVRVNRAVPAGFGFPSETEVWDSQACMSNPNFASDHAMVLARMNFVD